MKTMTTTKRVRNILEVSQKARNSDKELWIIYAQKSGLNLTPEQIEIIRGMPSFETFRRVRQDLQAKGDYPADPRVAKQRKLKAMIVQQNAPTASTEYLDKIVEEQPEPVRPLPTKVTVVPPTENSNEWKVIRQMEIERGW